jgi:glutathione S-transferase
MATRGSGSTRRVLAALEYIGLDYELIEVDLFKGENRAAGYLEKNPNGAIPVLEDGSLTIYEAAAINIYLAEKHNSDLLPSGDDRYHTLKWMFWAAEHFRQGPPVLFNERIAKRFMGAPEDARAAAGAEASLRKFSSILDGHLANRRFVVAERFTLADIDLAAPLSQMTRSKLPYHEFPNIMTWYARLTDEVPAWRHSGELLEKRMAALQQSFSVTL